MNVVVSEDWGSGYCADVTVENVGDVYSTWEVEIDLGGTLTDLWNAVSSDGSTGTLFSGESWNSLLLPGDIADFGYCVDS